MKKIIITAGGTQEPIDKVRSITNKSTGKLGALIGQKFLELEEDVEIIYLHGKNAFKIETSEINKEKIRYIEVPTTNDLEYQITKLLSEETIDIFVHSMAVADYSVDKVVDLKLLKENLREEFTISSLKETKMLDIIFKTKEEPLDEQVFDKIFDNCLSRSTLDNSSKLSSNSEENAVILKRNKKIISLIKELSPLTFLVGFKLLNDVNENNLFNVGFELLRKNRCNLVFANDLSHIKTGNHDGLLIFPEKNSEYLSGKEKIAYFIAKESLKRQAVYHPKSVKIGENPVIPQEIFNKLKYTGASLYSSYLLPEVSNYENSSDSVSIGTYGNMSIYEDENIYMTGRNVHKGNLQVEDLALIVGVKEEKIDENLKKIYSKVKYLGHKPSIDATIHASIYKETDYKAIIHIHTDKVFLGYPMITENFPCGSDAERDAIIEAIKTNPGKKVIQMYKHGLIVLGESIEDCQTTLNEIMFEGLYIGYKDHTWEEQTLAHVKEVNGKRLIKNEDIYALYNAGELIGNIYEKRDTDVEIPEIKILNFAIITGEKAKKKGLGIVKKYLDLWQNSYEMRLHTTTACEIKDLYIEKYGFIPTTEKYLLKDENHIILVKTPYPLIIGLSGYSGSGKSSLADALMDEYGYYKIDCDILAKKTRDREDVQEEIIKEFGEDILLKSKSDDKTQIDRKKLGEIVFNNEDKRQKLNQIMYPRITEEIKDLINKHKGQKILIDAPTIYEVPEIMEICDKLLIVKASQNTLIERITRRDHITPELAKARLEKQIGLSEYEKQADIIINNDTDIPYGLFEEWNNILAQRTVQKIFKL